MLQGSGGGRGIRTPVGFQTQTVFKTASLWPLRYASIYETAFAEIIGYSIFLRNIFRNAVFGCFRSARKVSVYKAFLRFCDRCARKFSRPPRYDHFDIPPCYLPIIPQTSIFVKSREKKAFIILLFSSEPITSHVFSRGGDRSSFEEQRAMPEQSLRICGEASALGANAVWCCA